MLRTLSRTLVALLAVAAAGAAGADVYQLKSGGQISGELIERGQRGSYVVRSPEGVKITLPRLDVAKIVPEQPALAEYRQRSRAMPDTVEAHRELAAWCTEQQLTEQADHHLRRLLQLDPADEAARKSLDYQRYGNRWLTREQIMQERGMVFFEGKYRTPQTIALRKLEEAAEKRSAEWYGKLRIWRGWLLRGRADRVAEAKSEIARIADPLAAPALVKWLSDESDAYVRRMLLETLQGLNTPLAQKILVRLSLHSDDVDERLLCLDYLTRNNAYVNLTPYVKALGSKDNLIVNRAAAALAVIGDSEAISPLIDSLITRHKFIIRGNSPGQTNASFSPTGGSGLSMGGNGDKVFFKDLDNLEVLRALGKLSDGQNFGYNETAWRRWFVNEQKYEYFSSRRDQ